MDNVTGGSGDTVTIDGQPRHVSGYLRDFLFPPERLHAPVSMLSGGERNRLLLARLFAKPSNLLVMDEPTNDLDVETLELLEEMVANYRGDPAAGQPRSRLSRQRRHQHAGVRRRGAGQRIRRRLQRLAASAQASAAPKRRAKSSRAPAAPRPAAPARARPRQGAAPVLQGAARARDHCRRKFNASKPSSSQLQAAIADPNLFKAIRAGGTAALQRLQSLAAELERLPRCDVLGWRAGAAVPRGAYRRGRPRPSRSLGFGSAPPAGIGDDQR